MIKYKGFQVAPAELEAVICGIDVIVDCCVIPIHCEVGGEVPRAYVVRQEGSGITEEEVKAHVEERCSPHKKLRGGVKFVEVIPKTASGKILRRVVIEMEKKNECKN